MWPNDDECESVENDDSNSSFQLDDPAPKSTRATYSSVPRFAVRLKKISLVSTLEALQSWRAHTKESHHFDIPRTAQSCRDALRKLSSVRCSAHLATVTALVDTILKEASKDLTLSEELRAYSMLLPCFVHVAVEEKSKPSGGHTWIVRMKASVEDTRRYRPLQHMACSATFAEARTRCAEDDLIERTFRSDSVPVALVRRKGFEHLTAGNFEETSDDVVNLPTVASLGKYVVILLYDKLPAQVEIQIECERQLIQYAKLHSVARWMDSVDLMKRSDEDFLSTLACLTKEYPRSLDVFAQADDA
ncbi:hypothetical protein CYMTET_2873 [Cymbomonas tetramitiformis]|uniref:Uncharacterized protein n=1 Tax=Cymbomonas tetramitiformis TaxID=36881 RepID=A0AAE0LM57_9CHLO|nr:hypothetical protein CYMTET_2873 [Cymbomonas tetramitiformis]